MNNHNSFFRTVLVALLMSMACSLGAQNQFWVGGIHYEVMTNQPYYYDGNCTVRVIDAGSDGYSGTIVIPKVVMCRVSSSYGDDYQKSFAVAEVGIDAFRDCKNLTSVVLPSSIKTIGKNAFYGCSALSSVTIPNGVNTIQASAFGYCTSLTSIVLPNSVMTLGDNVFYGCSSLTSVTLSKNIGSLKGAFQGCTSLVSIDLPPLMYDLNGTFKDCTSLTSVNMPKSISVIESNAFDGCTALRSIFLPDGLTRIGNRAFAGTGLTSLEIPSTVSSINDYAFDECNNLTSVSVRAANPPGMTNNGIFSSETYASALLKVPEVSLTAYQSAYGWKQFQNISGDAELNTHYDLEVNGIYYLKVGPNAVKVTYKDDSYNSYSGSVNIPATVTSGGTTYDVIGVGHSAFRNSTLLTAVTMPASVTSIDGLAFYGCSGLSTIEIPDGVTTIANAAFSGCSGLTSLTIPESVAFIGGSAFYGIPVQSLTWNARECWSNGDMTTSNITEVSIGDQVRVIPPNFARCAKLSSLELPASLTTIGDEAFYYNEGKLPSLTIPEGVVYVGSEALAGLRIQSLTWNARECWSNGRTYYSIDYNNVYWMVDELTIGDRVEVIPNNFVPNTDIRSLTIPASVKYIGRNAFNNCSYLTGHLIIPDSVLIIGEKAFCHCDGISEITIGKGVTSIGEDAFTEIGFKTLNWNARHCESSGMAYDCHSVNQVLIGDEVEVLPCSFVAYSQISQVDIPSSVKTICDGAFEGCYNLGDVTLPNSVTSVGESVFAWSSLTGITLSNSLTSIGRYAFSGCGNLTEVTIPNSVTKIGNEAFSSCEGLTSLTLSSSLDSIGSYAFNYCRALTSLHIPASVTSIGSSAFNNCKGLESISVEQANTVYDSRENCNAILKTANDSIILTCKNTVLPGTITAIPDYAFNNNTELTHIDIPASVTYIGKYAFNGCTNLTEITIPAAVTTIGERAFSGCTSLQSMVVEEGNTVYDSRGGCNAVIETSSNALLFGFNVSTIPVDIEAIGSYAFYGCENLATANIPKSVKSIGDYAFNGCKGLTTMSVPDSVTSIGVYAFNGCRGLTKITLGNSLTQISNHMLYGCSSLTEVSIPASVMTISNYAFGECRRLTNIRIPDGVTSIGAYAFDYCWDLKTVTLGKSLKSIGYYAFNTCNELKTVNSLATTPPSISSYWCFTLSTYSNATLRVLPEALETYKTANYWKNFANIEALAGSGPGDMNGDGRLSIGDVTGLIDALLTGDPDVLSNPYADVNGDGKISIGDITALINMLLSNS